MTQHTIAADGKLFFEQVHQYLTIEECIQVHNAFELARHEHGDQVRKSGELFFTHPLTVAYYLSQYSLDASALIAALLHDVAEDTYLSIEDIENSFGAEVATLVDGVTKLKQVTKEFKDGNPLSKKEIEEATLYKLLGVMTNDLRAVIIKLFDRLHNMRTIGATPKHRQEYKANETLEVYAPLANRLGIWKIKNELESLSIEVLDPERYETIKSNRQKLVYRQEQTFPKIQSEIETCLQDANLKPIDVLLAPENIPTLYRDCQQNPEAQFDQTMRVVIILDRWQDCYTALGHIHHLWKPVPEKFDDYIAFPRNNLYRSLHTTVVHTNGQHIKIRLRTTPMHKVSEVGVLAQWMYRDKAWFDAIESRMSLFLENINDNINMEPQDPFAGVKGVVEDVFQEKQIQVYTPQGMVVELADGATPIDFAYAIHTGLGDQCFGAKVNGFQHPLNKPLKNGNYVKIIKRIHAQPQRAWLDEDLGYIKTNYAMVHARRWFRRLSSDKATAQGKSLLALELEMLGLPLIAHRHVASLFEYDDLHDFYHDIGRAELLPTVVATRLLEEQWQQGPARYLDKQLYSDRGEKFTIMHADNRELQFCLLCTPQPSGAIVGYLRKDGKVTVHHEGCHKLPHGLNGRILKLSWGKDEHRRVRMMTVRIKVHDRPGLLYEITHLMQQEKVNISYVNTPPSPKGQMHLVFTLGIFGARQFVRILHRAKALVNVIAVHTLESHLTPEQQIPATSLYRPE